MAVSTTTSVFYDTKSSKNIDVHSIKVTKSNRKGAAACVGGEIVENKDGSWHISVPSKINGRKVKLLVFANQFIFRTGQNNRWQSLPTSGFNDRFKVALKG